MKNGNGASVALELSRATQYACMWVDEVERVAAKDEKDKEKIKGKTCKIYNKNSQTNNLTDVCPCGRLVRRHSNQGDCLQTDNTLATFQFANGPKYTRQTALKHYGILPGGCKFIRCSEQTPSAMLYKLILNDRNGQKPSLIISVYGGAKYFVLTERLEKEFMRGIIEVATIAGTVIISFSFLSTISFLILSSDAWILTAGLNNGISKLVGEGISQYRLLKRHPKQVVCIGMTMWGSINEKTRIELKKLREV